MSQIESAPSTDPGLPEADDEAELLRLQTELHTAYARIPETFRLGELRGYVFVGAFPRLPSPRFWREQEWLQAMMNNPAAVIDVSDEKIEQVAAYDRMELKVHLTLSPSQRIEFLQILAREWTSTYARMNPTFAKGQSIPAGQYPSFVPVQAKVKEVEASEDPRLADAVFYPSNEEWLGKLLADLAKVSSALGLSDSETLPRFSSRARTDDGSVIPGVSFTQGNGDFKDFLLRKGGKVLLDRFYDPATGYARAYES